jgi:phenylpropionate dioxygenase-like ring-hydroxylating dioxygenase large terminal subunit
MSRVLISHGIEKTVPAVPQAWYLMGASRDLARGALWSREIAGEPIVIYRGDSGVAYALGARCWHMGAHLGRGRVCGEQIQCALHRWQYDGDGICRHVPERDSPPAAARQPRYALAERFGAVFVFNAAEPLFPLPGFATVQEADVVAGVGNGATLGAAWYTIAANAFDRQHLEAVHERALREPPIATPLDAFRYQWRYRSRVVGTGAADKVMQWLSQDDIHVTITCWGGALFTIESDLGRVQSNLLVSLCPTATGTQVTPLFAMARTGNAALDAARWQVSRWLFSAFLMKDVAVLEGMEMKVRLPMPPDEPLAGFVDWLDRLP